MDNNEHKIKTLNKIKIYTVCIAKDVLEYRTITIYSETTVAIYIQT